MSVINCLPRNDAAISRDRCSPPLHLPTSHLSPSNPSTFLGPFSFIPLCSSQLCSSRVRSFVRASLARPAPPLSFLSFVLSSFFLFRSATGTSNAFKQSLYLRFDTPGDTSARNNERKTFPRVRDCVSVDFCPSVSACLLPSAFLPSMLSRIEIHVLFLEF